MDIWTFYSGKNTEQRLNAYLSQMKEDDRQELVDLLNDLAAESYDLGCIEGEQSADYARAAAFERNHEEF